MSDLYSVKTEPSEEVKFLAKLKSLPAPPPTDIDSNPKNSPLTTLFNACTANRKDLKFVEARRGQAHTSMWTETCTIDDKEYGQGEASKKTVAKDIAARKTLEILRNEENSFITTKMNYLPIFNDYRKSANLEDCLQYECVPRGPDHDKSWGCTIVFDDVPIAFAQAQRKELAMEGAARNVANDWHSLS